MIHFLFMFEYNICYSLDSNYAEQLAVSIASVLKNADTSMVSSNRMMPMGVTTPSSFPETVMIMTPATGMMQNSACRRVGYSRRNSAPVPMVTTGTTASTKPAMVVLVYKRP